MDWTMEAGNVFPKPLWSEDPLLTLLSTEKEQTGVQGEREWNRNS